MKTYPKVSRTKGAPPANDPPFIRELRTRQNNLLPQDLIANGRGVDDALWNGPKHESKIQRAGVIVIGAALLMSAVAVALIGVEQKSWIVFVPSSLIGYAGLRAIYKSVRTSR